MVRKIVEKVPDEQLRQDLEKYRQRAIELGATDARIITTDMVLIDERVRAKCIYPKCTFYGNNMNCPPYAPDLDFVRKLIARYSRGILFCVKGDTKDFVGPDFLKKVGRNNRAKSTLNTICSEIESRAFYEGYPFALALGQGPCKTFWCPDQPCSGLEPGKACRFALKARASVESLGMDAYTMAAKQGWEIYPCGARVEVDKLPHVLLIGLILII